MRVSNGQKDRKRSGVFALVRRRVGDAGAGGADELACKPDSVPRSGRGGDHPSGAVVAGGLERSTRELGRAALERSLSDLAPGGVYRAARVTPGAGGLFTPPFHPCRAPKRSAVCFLWHCPAGRPGWALPTTLPCGVRTFLGGARRRRRGRPASSSRFDSTPDDQSEPQNHPSLASVRPRPGRPR